ADQAHTQALTHRFKPGDRFTNSLIAFSAMNQSEIMLEAPSVQHGADWAHGGLNIKSTPYIFGLKDTIAFDWWEHAFLRASIGVQYYLFKTGGSTLDPTSNYLDINDPGSIKLVSLGETYKNLTFEGYADNKFTFGGLVFTPGVALNWLERNGKYYADPRGVISYTFHTGTTIGVAGGYYSMFIQTVPVLFTILPNVAGFDFGPQRAIHRSVSAEQEMKMLTLRIEGYCNSFWDTVWNDDTPVGYSNKGRERSLGLEFSVKINNEEEQGFFGYLSYTYNEAKQKSNQADAFSSYYPAGFMPGTGPPPPVATESYGHQWFTGDYDMTHVIKFVLGYTFGKNTLSSKFQFNTARPYTEIVSSYEDATYPLFDPSRERHMPLYGLPNTARLSPEYRLDLRYSRKTNYKWGYVSWYFEIIGIVTSPSEDYRWDYRYSYGTNNNPRIEKTNSLTIIPNFGVETKF
ncbi:MAG: hypothetical protein FWG92_02255, partial [Leptospirales bacterium]|nr:hypothetical protein [Leptospirales bacterium]